MSGSEGLLFFDPEMSFFQTVRLVHLFLGRASFFDLHRPASGFENCRDLPSVGEASRVDANYAGALM